MEIFDDSAWNSSKLVPLEEKTGTMVRLHGLLPHMIYANRSSRSRQAYTIHIIDKVINYFNLKWLEPPPEMTLRGF